MAKESNQSILLGQCKWQWWGGELYSIFLLESLQDCEMTKLIRNKSILKPIVAQCLFAAQCL